MSSFAITSVTVCKLRARGASYQGSVAVGKSFDGMLLWEPRVGDRLVICRPRSNHLTTTPVKRLLVEDDGRTVYAETSNSVYKLTFATPVSGVVDGRVVLRPDGPPAPVVEGEITGVADEQHERQRRDSGSYKR